jgi:hypothetical protein
MKGDKTEKKIPHLRGHDLKELRMDRHSMSPKAHCSPNHSIKKDGLGGKYTWGGPLDPVGPAALDEKDPNFDEEENVH